MKLTGNNPDPTREQMALALREWREEVDLRAFGATCPMPHCGALAITYEASDSIRAFVGANTWEFVCAECGAEFTATRRDLLFQSVPREWLLSEVCYA